MAIDLDPLPPGTVVEDDSPLTISVGLTRETSKERGMYMHISYRDRTDVVLRLVPSQARLVAAALVRKAEEVERGL